MEIFQFYSICFNFFQIFVNFDFKFGINEKFLCEVNKIKFYVLMKLLF